LFRIPALLLLPTALAGGPKGDNAAPAPPPAALALRVEAPDVSSPWKMIVTNAGEIPVRLAADGRLLRFEVLPPEGDDAEPPKGHAKKAKAPVICRLPLGFRPGAVVEDRVVLLAPHTRYEEIVNPALYCFGKKEREALVPGASVTAKLGFAPAKARGKKEPPLLPPFVGEPTLPNAPVSPVKELVAETFTAAAAPPPQKLAAETIPSDDPGAPRLEISAPSRIEAANTRSAEITVTIKNVGSRPTKVRLRRDDVTFIVEGPNGTLQCGVPVLGRASPPESFMTLRASAVQRFAIRLFEPCPDGAFDQPGLYRVRATLTLTEAGEKYAIRAFTGIATQKEETLIRVDAGTEPFYATPPQVFGAAKPEGVVKP
jgi:hypothetical protein